MICNQVPIEEVQNVLKQNICPTLQTLSVTFQPYAYLADTFIPKDFVGTTQIKRIEIAFYEVSNKPIRLQIDADAFRSTKNYTNFFKIGYFDCTQLDLGFLSGFDNLATLYLLHIDNIQHCLPSLPPLPQLTVLRLEHCSGMNELINYPSLINGLHVVAFLADVDNIHHETYNDETVDRIMDWLLLSSATTLEEIIIRGMNQVTRIPQKIPSFKALSRFEWDRSNISIVKSGTFSFSVPVSELKIKENGIKEIEPGAFKGTLAIFM